jgi:hypothetical protein
MGSNLGYIGKVRFNENQAKMIKLPATFII